MIPRPATVLLSILILGVNAALAGDLPPPGVCVLSLKLVSERGGLRRMDDSTIGDGWSLYEKADGTLYFWLHENDHSMDGDKGPKNEVWTLQPYQARRLRNRFTKSTLHDFDFAAHTRYVSRLNYFPDVQIHFHSDISSEAGIVTDLDFTSGQPNIGDGGATVRAFCHWAGVNFDFESEDLENKLGALAKRDSELSQLRDLLDAVAQAMGRHDLLLE
jgi:hypothetical protein